MLQNFPQILKNLYSFAYFDKIKFKNAKVFLREKGFNNIQFNDDNDLINYFNSIMFNLLYAEKENFEYSKIFATKIDYLTGKEKSCSVCIGKNNTGENIYVNFIKNKFEKLGNFRLWNFHSICTQKDESYFFRNNRFKTLPREDAYEEFVLKPLREKQIIRINKNNYHPNHLVTDHLYSEKYNKENEERFPYFINKDKIEEIIKEYQLNGNKNIVESHKDDLTEYISKLIIQQIDAINKNIDNNKSQRYMKFIHYLKDENDVICGKEVAYAYPILLKLHNVNVPYLLICNEQGTPLTIYLYKYGTKLINLYKEANLKKNLTFFTDDKLKYADFVFDRKNEAIIDYCSSYFNDISISSVFNTICFKKQINNTIYYLLNKRLSDSEVSFIKEQQLKNKHSCFFKYAEDLKINLTKENIERFFQIVDFKENKLNDFFLQYLSEISDFDINNPKALFHCINPKHEDEHASMGVNLHNMTCHCFACNATYNLLQLVNLKTGLKTWDSYEYLYSKYSGKKLSSDLQKLMNQQELQNNDNLELLNNLIESNEINPNGIDYLVHERKILAAQDNPLDLDIRSTQNRLYFILRDENGQPVSYQSRNITDKNNNFRYGKMAGGTAGLYFPSEDKEEKSLSYFLTNDSFILNEDIKPKKIIELFEGEIDALTAYFTYKYINYAIDIHNNATDTQRIKPYKDMCDYNAIALSSIQNVNYFMKCLDDINVSNKKNIIISLCLDNDKYGQEAENNLAKELLKRGYTVNRTHPYKEKDINEENIKNREELFFNFQRHLNNCLQISNESIKNIDDIFIQYLFNYLPNANHIYYMYGIKKYSDLIKLEDNERNNSNEFIMDSSIYYSNTTQTAQNCIYTNRCNNSLESIREALSHDYVCANYIDNKRSNVNFINSNILPVDIDNDHSDKEEDWITDDQVCKLFKDCSFIIHYSRNHMKEKHGQIARPRFHVLFSINTIDNVKEYSNLKIRLHRIFPYIDDNALDGARFFFGTENPQFKIHQGSQYLDRWIDQFEIDIYKKSLNIQKNVEEITKKKDFESRTIEEVPKGTMKTDDLER